MSHIDVSFFYVFIYFFMYVSMDIGKLEV